MLLGRLILTYAMSSLLGLWVARFRVLGFSCCLDASNKGVSRVPERGSLNEQGFLRPAWA